jgi:UDP-glucose 4-epimerase
MRTDPRVLVTGSSGTIGTALAERLLAEGWDVVGADRVPNRWSSVVDARTVAVDLRDRAATDALPANVDVVVHLAANARVTDLIERPEKARDNLETTVTALEYARERDVSGVVFASSREVYGDQSGTARGEGDTSIEDCKNPYAASKVGGEAMTRSYAQCYGLDATVLRFSNVYGRYDVTDRVVPLFLAQAARGEDLTVYGRDKVVDLTYIDDLVDGIVRTLADFETAAGETFNLGSGTGTSLLSLAETVTDRFPTGSDVRVERNRTGEVERFVADISRARAVLGYEPTRSPLGGLDPAIDWYRENDLLGAVDPGAVPDGNPRGAIETN